MGHDCVAFCDKENVFKPSILQPTGECFELAAYC